jgi:hypothetical protein
MANVRREIAEKLYALSTDKHRVYCLSKRWNNLSMWENFASIILDTAWNSQTTGASRPHAKWNTATPRYQMDITDPEDRGPYCFFKLREYSGEEESG